MSAARMRFVTDDRFVEAVTGSTSVSGTMRFLGVSKSGNSFRSVKTRIEFMGLSTDHFVATTTGQPSQVRMTADEFLVILPVGSQRTARRFLARSLLEIGVAYKCAVCGLCDDWNGSPVTLQIDHQNGNPLDNRRENLRFLCPNCHSQTETFGNKRRTPKELPRCVSCSIEMKTVTPQGMCRKCVPHRAKINWPTTPELQTLVDHLGYRQAGRVLGVSDNSIRKRLKNHGGEKAA